MALVAPATEMQEVIKGSGTETPLIERIETCSGICASAIGSVLGAFVMAKPELGIPAETVVGSYTLSVLAVIDSGLRASRRSPSRNRS